MDDMDMILMQGSHDQNDFPRITKSFSYTNSPRSQVSLSRPPDTGNPLKFHLNTDDAHGGFMLSLSKARIAHFRHVLSTSKLHLIETEEACNKILSKANSGELSKADFDAAIETILPTKMAEPQSRHILSDIFNNLFAGFDREDKNSACALEVACGFTVLCRGKKSDKLEFAFEVLDKNKNSRLSQDDMTNYLRSFLVVLLSIAFSRSLCNDPVDDSLTTTTGIRCDRTTATLKNAASEGAKWASSLAFADFQRKTPQATAMSFDDFADWYTSAGYSSIPWLELLDLQKWAMND
jgi:Ca2+-binding EF-hand superfamily protein